MYFVDILRLCEYGIVRYVHELFLQKFPAQPSAGNSAGQYLLAAM